MRIILRSKPLGIPLIRAIAIEMEQVDVMLPPFPSRFRIELTEIYLHQEKPPHKLGKHLSNKLRTAPNRHHWPPNSPNSPNSSKWSEIAPSCVLFVQLCLGITHVHIKVQKVHLWCQLQLNVWGPTIQEYFNYVDTVYRCPKTQGMYIDFGYRVLQNELQEEVGRGWPAPHKRQQRSGKRIGRNS